MGLALIFFLICLVIGAIVYSCLDPADDRLSTRIKHALMGVCISMFVIGLITTPFILGASWDSYLDNRAFYDATLEQYRGAVEMYKDYAVIDMKKTHERVFTDLKYQGYQKHMAEKIDELKVQVVAYNRSFVLKRVKNATWFFNWYIIANDPDMKIIRMIEKEVIEE